MPSTNKTSSSDQVFQIINRERRRQRQVIDLIPSENHASPAVHRAVGSVLMHKYAEGYPRQRYYQGNAHADQVEDICRRRALETFGLQSHLWGVNVQGYSGSPANLAVYNALLRPAETIMAMYLPDGGHLSHGWKFKQFSTLVGKIWNIHYYHVAGDQLTFDYDQLEQEAVQAQPQLIISGGTAYPRQIDHYRMGRIAKRVGAYYLADISHEAGLIAAGVNAAPFRYADVVMTTTHKTLRGPRGALIFGRRRSRIKPEVDVAYQIDRSIFPGIQGGPHLHTIAGVAVALREAQRPAFRRYAQQVLDNTQVMAREFKRAGYRLISGGSDKHYVLVDVHSHGVEAWLAAWALEYAGIVLNRNTIPNESGSPYYPSGVRLGAPVVTTRGMKTADIEQVMEWLLDGLEYSRRWQLPGGGQGNQRRQRRAYISQFLSELPRDRHLNKLRRQVTVFAKQFPVFSW
ncbi:MAG: serine hydroxymethyltransferase [Candidatus Pacebacteria bacterium CG10_big_fil_rev_8_21_14_0_10_56_10]|nr:MAG: serine hydroxymethyltransferase [Candidatus Pacebacteria bacterium CG10_big_fil_rev_8_21_14_0_10_56_10]